MGVDCSIRLPANVRFNDVAQVIGILLGQPFQQTTISGSNAVHVQVDGVVTRGSSMPECGMIEIPDKGRHFLYHFEFSGPSYRDHDTECGRGLLLSSYAENIALGVRLVKFFGGSVDFNDCDTSDCDFAWPEQPDIRANNGEAWDEYHRRMLALTPITKDEIKQYQKAASYR